MPWKAISTCPNEALPVLDRCISISRSWSWLLFIFLGFMPFNILFIRIFGRNMVKMIGNGSTIFVLVRIDDDIMVMPYSIRYKPIM